MKLYTLPGACSTADHIALHWSGLPFTVDIVTRDGPKAAEVRALNPAGTLPVLVDGDFVLTQNAAILGYIADKAPQARLLGDGSARQRAEATRWLMFSNADLQPMFGAFFAPGLLIEDAAQHEALQARTRRRMRTALECADAHLAGRDWLAGFRSVADAHFCVMLRWAAMFRIDLAGLDRLVAYKLRLAEDFGVQAALTAEGLA